VYHQGEEVMHIEPLNRPHVWQPLRLEALETEESDGTVSEE
jgi:diadenylate cyclase